MGRMLEHPTYNVISARLSDRDYEALQKLMAALGTNVSGVIKQGLAALAVKLTKAT